MTEVSGEEEVELALQAIQERSYRWAKPSPLCPHEETQRNQWGEPATTGKLTTGQFVHQYEFCVKLLRQGDRLRLSRVKFCVQLGHAYLFCGVRTSRKPHSETSIL